MGKQDNFISETHFNGDEFTLKCACGCKMIHLEKFKDEKEIYLTTYRRQGDSYTFWWRIKTAIKILVKGFFMAEAIVLDEGTQKLLFKYLKERDKL